MKDKKRDKKEKILGNYYLVLGLEIHLHVKLSRKMFCSCTTEGIYEAKPNTHTCPVCLGMPGALPVPNREAIEKTQKLGLALNCKVNTNSRFDRKHYFYPDLPKGYQISQYKQPFCESGYLDLSSGSRVEIERIHLEEDTAKSFHEGPQTLIDFNKSGMALIEMVTHPSIYSVVDAVEYCKKVREIVRHFDISDADMEKGQLRIEPNISLRTREMKQKNTLPSYKVEVKNINSFKFMERAVISEIKRQRDLLEAGKAPLQENRGFNENTGKTVPQRSKEEAKDYRYFPEPDIPPMEFDSSYIGGLEESLPRLPDEIKEDLMKEFELSKQEVEVILSEELVDLLRKVIQQEGVPAKEAVNLLVNRIEYRRMSPSEFYKEWKKEQEKIRDVAELESFVEEVLKENQNVVKQIKDGKESAKQYLVGQVMRKTRGKADPVLVKELINKHF